MCWSRILSSESSVICLMLLSFSYLSSSPYTVPYRKTLSSTAMAAFELLTARITTSYLEATKLPQRVLWFIWSTPPRRLAPVFRVFLRLPLSFRKERPVSVNTPKQLLRSAQNPVILFIFFRIRLCTEKPGLAGEKHFRFLDESVFPFLFF